MKYAVRNTAGSWTGAVYDRTSPAIIDHHAAYAEELIAVSALERDEAGEWTATEASPAEIAATLTVTRFQARAALHQAGLLADVEAAVAASDDPTVKLAWAESIEFPRGSPTIAALAVAIGLTDAEVDALFIAAAAIQA